ncbi:MAG: C25 family cysteine peptidase [Salinivirgaceae bacterium]|nr:C25 family cysteine peptidase [Salinivirgaceae bacterium]
MKKVILIFVFVISVPALYSQILRYDYEFSNMQIQGSAMEKSISIDKCTNVGLYGNPQLPWRACNIVLPPGTIVERVVIVPIFADTIPIFGKIRPAGHVRPISKAYESDAIELNGDIYNLSEFTGQNFGAIRSKVHLFNSVSVLMFGILPVKYNPVEGKLIFYKKVTVEIYGKIGRDTQSVLQHDYNLLQQFVDNPQFLAKAPPQSGDVNTIDILIVTSREYYNSVSLITKNYHAIGKKTKLITTEDIKNMYVGVDLAEKIRNCIKYYNQNKNTRYVLLAGDTEIIPDRKLRAVVQSSGVYTGNIPSDLYYAALDGNWDTNQNGIYGEPDEADLLPDIAIGRIPFSSNTELSNFLLKTTQYQFSPVLIDTNKPLLVGEHLWDNPLTYGAQYLDLVIGAQNQNGYFTTGIPINDPYDSLYDRTQIWDEYDLRNKIMLGTSFIHHVGHASYYSNMRLTSEMLTSTFFAAINGVNRLNPVIYSHGCLSAAFDENLCIGEKMIFLPNFASAYVGNSRYGWFNEGQTEGPSAHQHREFVNALYGFNASFLGLAHQVSQLRTAAWVDLPNEYEPGAQRWAFYSCNVLGDPLMGIWTDIPISYPFNVVGQVYAGSNQIQISSSGVSNSMRLSLVDKFGKLRGTIDSVSSQNTLDIFPTIREPDTLFLISSGNNVKPDTVHVVFGKPTTPTLVLQDFIIVESDYQYGVSGHDLKLLLRIENVGVNSANDCKAFISALTPGIEVEGVEINFGTIHGNEIVEGFTMLEFSIPHSIQNNTNIFFQVDLLIGSSINHMDYFKIPVFAPILVYGKPIWNDIIGGNGNEVVERGEVVVLQIPVSNIGGTKSDSISYSLTSSNSSIQLVNNGGVALPLEALKSFDINAIIQVDDQSEVGDSVYIELIVTHQGEVDTILVQTRINLPVEEFFMNQFTFPIWENTSAIPWTFANKGVSDSYCLQSGAISHNQFTEVKANVTALADDQVSFWVKTSCEYSESVYPYDRLEFSIDGTRVGWWDNLPNWHAVLYPISEGIHELKWRYVKDGGYSAGSDAVWIDRIIFPPTLQIPVVENNPPQINSLNGNVFVFSSEVKVDFTVFDPDNDPVSVTLVNNPSWISLAENGGTWTITGTLPENAQSEYTIQIIASDGTQATVESIDIQVSGVGITNRFDNSCFLQVYPNPACQRFSIAGLPAFEKGILSVYDMMGHWLGSMERISDEVGKIVVEKFGFVQKNGVYLLDYQFGTCKGTTVLIID